MGVSFLGVVILKTRLTEFVTWTFPRFILPYLVGILVLATMQFNEIELSWQSAVLPLGAYLFATIVFNWRHFGGPHFPWEAYFRKTQIIIEAGDVAAEAAEEDTVEYYRRELWDTLFDLLKAARLASDKTQIEDTKSDITRFVHEWHLKPVVGTVEASFEELIMFLAVRFGFDINLLAVIIDEHPTYVVELLHRMNLVEDYQAALNRAFNTQSIAYRELFQIYTPTGLSEVDDDFVRGLIENHENQTCELKSSFNRDLKTGQKKSQEIRHSSMKTIAGFLNTQGGFLVIGVEDSKNILGVEEDLSDFSEDLFERGFMEVARSALTPFDPTWIDTSFNKIDGKTVFLVKVKRSSTLKQQNPVYLHMPQVNKEPQLYRRIGAATPALTVKEAADFIKTLTVE